MELRQLEYFQMVGTLKSFTKASNRMHVTQPAITVAIQKLEEELGVVLLDRSQKAPTLTSEGHILLKHVHIILQDIATATLELADYKNLRKGNIRLGLPAMLGSFILPKVFEGFLEKYPDIELVATEHGSLRIRELLLEEELDAGIVVITNHEQGLSTLPIYQGEIHLCLNHQDPLAELSNIALSNLDNRSFVMPPEGTYIRQQILQECQAQKINHKIILSTAQMETLTKLVSQGMGVSFLFDFVAKQYPNITSRPLNPPLPLEVGIAWKKDKYISRATQAFINYMKGSCIAK